jgi:hypothetical protein
MREISVFLAILTISVSLCAKPVERTVNAMGFRGKISLTPLADERVLVEVRAGRVRVTDTVRGHSLFPVLLNGRSQAFYFGRLGASRFPMLVFGVTDPERVQDSRLVAYQVSPGGALIGQQVIVDDALRHGHTDDVSAGRYQLASVDPRLGALYSVAYQDARFAGVLVTYEKLRVRQWDPSLGAFIEADQGFLRERSGRLLESTKFHGLNDRSRSQVFVANLRSLESVGRLPSRAAVRATPVSTMR